MMPAVRRNYIIQRLDSFVSDGGASYNVKLFTIEHVLPQNPSEGSEWLDLWPDTDVRRYWLNRIANLVKGTGVNTSVASVIDYIRYAQEACLVFTLSNFASKFVERETVKKHYFTDNGLLSIFLTEDISSLLENLCAIHLYKQYEKELFYYNKRIEVDFYIPKKRYAVQVSFSIADESTRDREIEALKKFNNLEKLERLVIVTYDEEDTIELEDNQKIEVIPAWKWLLE